jgi:hypothetical protein
VTYVKTEQAINKKLKAKEESDEVAKVKKKYEGAGLTDSELEHLAKKNIKQRKKAANQTKSSGSQNKGKSSGSRKKGKKTDEFKMPDFKMPDFKF